MLKKSRPKKLRCHTKGEPVQYSLVSEQQGGCEPFLHHSLLFPCLQGHSGMPKILKNVNSSTSQLMSLFLKFWNEPAKLLGDLPCNTFTLQPLGCTLAYTQAQVKVEGILSIFLSLSLSYTYLDSGKGIVSPTNGLLESRRVITLPVEGSQCGPDLCMDKLCRCQVSSRLPENTSHVLFRVAASFLHGF